MMLGIDDVFGNSGDGAELAWQHATSCADGWIIKRRQEVVQPGRIAGQPVRGTEVGKLLASGLLQDSVQGSRDVEVVAVIPQQSSSFVTGCQFQRRDRGRW